jgi:hypothetical protein
MAQYLADNFGQIPHNGAYGNKSVVVGLNSDISQINGAAGIANADTLDLVKIPAGARVLSGYLQTGTFAIATSTVVVGIRYADGTSTGGTTGTAVLVGGTSSAIIAALTPYAFRFEQPFVNDADTIAYITWLSPGAPSGASSKAALSCVLEYIADGTK